MQGSNSSEYYVIHQMEPDIHTAIWIDLQNIELIGRENEG